MNDYRMALLTVFVELVRKEEYPRPRPNHERSELKRAVTPSLIDFPYLRTALTGAARPW